MKALAIQSEFPLPVILFTEIPVAYSILRALKIRMVGPEIVSCPTCGRCQIDLLALTQKIENALTGRKDYLKVALMGCVVNGPGEAADADIGIAGGRGFGMLFKKGKAIKKIDEKDFVPVLLEEINSLLKEKEGGLMRYSEMHLPTGREVPSDAEVISHQLMIRAGMIRKLTSGIYSYLPLGYRVIRKVEQIIREEMNKAGAQEVHLPMVQPAELWQESGRWIHYGKELLRFRDRHEREYCLGPTHEEVITDLVRNDVKTYRQLPRNLYQIQTKFRDEVRPRFGVMRCREFGMKDAYSFDADEAGAEISYEKMFAAYNNIFRRCGLIFRPVEADSGSIGGKYSHEFMVMAESGEDAMVFCEKCTYAANLEKAEVAQPEKKEYDRERLVAFGKCSYTECADN